MVCCLPLVSCLSIARTNPMGSCENTTNTRTDKRSRANRSEGPNTQKHILEKPHALSLGNRQIRDIGNKSEIINSPLSSLFCRRSFFCESALLVDNDFSGGLVKKTFCSQKTKKWHPPQTCTYTLNYFLITCNNIYLVLWGLHQLGTFDFFQNAFENRPPQYYDQTVKPFSSID